MNKKYLLLAIGTLLISSVLFARENINMPSGKAPKSSGKTDVDCVPATAQFDMEINNVRARLLTGGDMWWDPVSQVPHYEVPKVPKGSTESVKNSIYAGALWVGGIDAGGQLKVAAQTYRQTGNDFWPGPLDDNGNIEPDVCSQYDRFFTVFRTDIENFLAVFQSSGGSMAPADVPENVLKWPGRNNPHFDLFSLPVDKDLAPFFDYDGDGDYDPTKGDYPTIPGCGAVYADQMTWWIFNDKGNVHSETGGEAINLEVGAMAFAYATNDELNNMTFYRYEVRNKSSVELDSTYFSQWVDPDLGNYLDDFVGCVPSEGLGVVYNCDSDDGDYGVPPMLAVDFFKGPSKFIEVNGVVTDTVELGMSSFVYYNNDFTIMGNPQVVSDFYGYMAGVWKDGTPFTYGGTGYGGDTPYPYMFPSDPTDQSPDAWSECKQGNPCGDRRFMQTAGPFKLKPGAINDIIIGAMWMPNVGGCPDASYDVILRADKKAQALFDNCFKLLDGPDAPELVIRELNQEVIISIYNDSLRSNNKFEQYSEADPVLRALGDAAPDSLYNFQGYKIYQLSKETVSSAEYTDPDLARLVAQVDIRDGISRIVNFTEDAVLGYVGEVKVEGRNEGIIHSFNVKNDLFAQSEDNKLLINNQRYYYSAVAYAYNGHEPFNPFSPSVSAQKLPYLEGRRNIKKYVAIPHIPSPQEEGIIVNSSFGDGPEIKTVQGSGNGIKGTLELTAETVTAALSAPYYAEQPIYQGGSGPVNIKIIDPFVVPPHDFELEMLNAGTNSILSNDTKWVLRDKTNGNEYLSETTIERANEQSIGGVADNSLGFSITIEQCEAPTFDKNAVVSSEITYEDLQNAWLDFIPDSDGQDFTNWIRSGESTADAPYPDYNRDILGYYETVLDGKAAPYCLTNKYEAQSGSNEANPLAPACKDCTSGTTAPTNTIANLASIDLVITPDASKWTRSVVVEMGYEAVNTVGNARKNAMRNQASVDKAGDASIPMSLGAILETGKYYYVGGTSASYIEYTDANSVPKQVLAGKFFLADNTVPYSAFNDAMLYAADDIGRSWFPGYAINVATGERLNIIFGENSFLGPDNGADMLWNPTSRLTNQAGGVSNNWVRAGGSHYIYVMNSLYDEGNAYHEKFVKYGVNPSSSTLQNKKDVWLEAMWVMLPLLSQSGQLKTMSEGLVPNTVTIKLRTEQPYRQEDTEPAVKYEFSMVDYAAKVAQSDVAKSAMDLIRIVPNPYYAFSTYERTQLDNRVRITNLPSRCNISIFTLEGTLIKSIKVDNVGDDTAKGDNVTAPLLINSVDWDLTNNKLIPIASGVYLIHIDAPDLGEERTLKWFCIKRPIDLDIF